MTATDVRAITVEWDEPANNGAAITDYDVQYQRDDETVWHNASHTGTGRTVTISNLLLGYGYRVQVRATNSAGTSAWSASGSGATESNTAATGKPTISGTLLVGETLTVDTSGITDADGLSGVSYGYQWRRDGADITGANSMTYTLAVADAGAAISVEVSFTDDGSFDEVLTSDATTTVAAANNPCANNTTTTCSVSPGSSVTGNIEVASDVDYFRLSVTSGLTYQIDMEGSPTSMGTLADPFIRLRDATVNSIDSDDNGGTGLNARLTWTADRTGTVYLLASENSRPSETGTYTLTVSVGIPDCGRSHWDRNKSLATQLLDASCEYQARSRNILADGQVSAQELAETTPLVTRLREIVDDLPCGSGPHRYYDPAGEQKMWKGPAPECLVRMTKSGGGGLPWDEILLSPASEDANSPATGAPSISGTTQVGETLTADVSGISDADGLANAVFSYQWQADAVDISGATGSTYTLSYAELDKAIRVRASFTDDAGHSEELTSAPTSAVALPPWSENLTRGRQPNALFAEANDAGIWLCWFAPEDAADEVTGYRVLRRLPETGGSFAPYGEDLGSTAAGVVGQCWTDGEVEEGVLYAYRVKAIRNHRELSRWSRLASARATVTPDTGAPANTPATGLPAITGTAQVGETLTADTSGIADEDGLDNAVFSYQWLADGAETQDATDATYTPVVDDVGKATSVTVSFTDDAGNEEELTSAATDAVEPETQEAQANNPATGLPTISGIAQVGVKLTADLSGIADEDGVTNAVLAYQWQADGADIPGETLNCYTPDDADEGKTISVRVTFTDDAGHEETLTRAATDAVEPGPTARPRARSP